MSKKTDIKTVQGYDPKPIFPICSNCGHFISEKVQNEYNFFEEKNIRCAIGGFAVKKQGTCNMHISKLNQKDHGI